METHCIASSLSPYRYKSHGISSSWPRISRHSFQVSISQELPLILMLHANVICKGVVVEFGFLHQKQESIVEYEEEPTKVSKKKGTGAVALIIGTSIGSGILALPQKTSPAGLIPNSIALTMCWAFLLLEALLLVEINVGRMRKRRTRVEDDFEIISIRTMAQETLGEWGGVLTTVVYIFLGYSATVAYNSKSGDIISHLIPIPYTISGFLFPVLFGGLRSFGGTRGADLVNQWLTVLKIGVYTFHILYIVF